jgi:hypothetical protein
MLEEPKKSPFVYVLAAVVGVAVIGIAVWLQRGASVETANTTPATKTPAGFVSAARPTPRAGLTLQTPGVNLTPDETALLATFGVAVARAGEPSIESKLPDLMAILQLHRLDAPPAVASASENNASRQRDRVEGILAASSVFLNARQLEIYRTHLSGQLQAPEARRTSK